MPLMRGAVMLAMLTATACVFHHHNVTCDIADAACGTNEACALVDSSVVCSCGDQQSTNAICGDGTVCSPDTGQCVTNNPPTAVIRSVKSDGTLRVPANATITLSGADSSDPEGGALTYAWSFTTQCGVASDVDLGQATVTFDSSAITAGCVVTLIVTDNLGATASASATLIPRAVGGFVSQTLPCVSTYQADSEDAQGTFDNPFCTPDQAVLAAADNAIDQIALAAETFKLSTTLDLGNTPVDGSYDVARTAPWTHGSGTTTLQGTSALHNNDVVRMAAAGQSGLSNVTIVRTTDCTLGCSIVEVTGTQANLSQVTIVTNESALIGSPITGTVISVDVHATDSDAVPTSITMSGCDIEGMSAAVTFAVRINGPIDAFIVNSRITGGGAKQLSAGLRTLDVHSLTVNASDIIISGPGDPAATAIGYLDGTNGQIFGTCNGNVSASCNGSAQITVQDTHVTVTGYPGTAIGIGAAKTDDLAIDGAVINTTSGQSVGVRTLDCDHARVVDSNITATGTPGSSFDNLYAAGIFDGTSIPRGSGNASNGSQVLDVTGGNIQGLVEANLSAGINISSVSGMLLYSTQGGTITSGQFSASCATLGRADIATAVTTWKTANIQFTDSSMSVNNLVATTRTSAFTDGRTQGAIGASASTNLGFSGGTYAADFSDRTDGVERAVMLFAGTTTSTIDGAQVSFTPGWAQATTPLSQAGVWTLATAGVTLKNITVTQSTAAVPTDLGTAPTWVYGMLDGPPEGTDGDTTINNDASHALVLDRNKVELGSASQATLVGIAVRGQANASGTIFDDYRFITNNFVDVSSDTLDFGIIVDRAQAAIYMNTIRYGVCASTDCPGGGAGIYLQQTGDVPASIIGNIITEGYRATKENSPEVLDLEKDSATVGLATFDYNARGGSGANPPDVVTEWAVAFNATRTHFVNIPTDLSPSDDLTERNKGVSVFGGADGHVVFCTDYHVTTGPVQAAIDPSKTNFVDQSLLAKDIDQNSRSGMWDAGANIRTVCH